MVGGWAVGTARGTAGVSVELSVTVAIQSANNLFQKSETFDIIC